MRILEFTPQLSIYLSWCEWVGYRIAANCRRWHVAGWQIYFCKCQTTGDWLIETLNMKLIYHLMLDGYSTSVDSLFPLREPFQRETPLKSLSRVCSSSLDRWCINVPNAAASNLIELITAGKHTQHQELNHHCVRLNSEAVSWKRLVVSVCFLCVVCVSAVSRRWTIIVPGSTTVWERATKNTLCFSLWVLF